NLEPLRKAGKMTRNFSISDGLRQIEDKQLDYIWCSHVFEHLEDPMAAAATFSRIGKRGTIVTPGPLKEELFAHEEKDHLWFVQKSGDELIFIRKDPNQIERIRDEEAQKGLCRFIRTGPNKSDDQRRVRQW